LLSRLDPWLYRRPFEGASARRYAERERCGFGDLDDRLIDRWAPVLAAADRVLEVGCGPATFARRVAERHPGVVVAAVEPSRDFARRRDGVILARARAEALPLADRSIAVAICLSSIRHVRDRGAALRELRRVVRPGGRLFIVELDPAAPRRRWRRHTRGLRSPVLRLAFVPLVLRTAPDAGAVASLARAAGWTAVEHAVDAEQPVYLLECT
jgi:SAM-dependent methyltransferase